MRLWSLHPSLLDRQGLLAAWREGLLAQSVIVRLQNGEKPGYRNHPQLARFLASPVPMLLIGTWLTFIQENATKRGYNFDKSKIVEPERLFRLPITEGQLEYEFNHLQAKLKERDNSLYWFNGGFTLFGTNIDPHPMFITIPGPMAEWEKRTTHDAINGLNFGGTLAKVQNQNGKGAIWCVYQKKEKKEKIDQRFILILLFGLILHQLKFTSTIKMFLTNRERDVLI